MRPVLLAVVLLQVGVPGVMLADRWADEGLVARSERPASFQMYSAVEPPAYVGVAASGAMRALAAPGVVGTGPSALRELCARHPDVVEVRRVAGVDRRALRC